MKATPPKRMKGTTTQPYVQKADNINFNLLIFENVVGS